MHDAISLLGSTGSIGRQTLEVASLLRIEVRALSANSNIGLLEEQVRKFKPRIASVFDERAARDFKTRVGDTGVRVVTGADGLIEAALCGGARTVVNALVGVAGLRPTLAAIEGGRKIALANKETLVCAGEFVMKAARASGADIIPIDSELSAVFQCLGGTRRAASPNADMGGPACTGGTQGSRSAGGGAPCRADDVSRIILTASGGPFRGMSRAEIAGATPETALRHPNWAMGKKVTIDSATLMNKGFEFAETFHLFSVPYEKIEIIVHPESIIHSMVEFADNSVMAQLSLPEMRLPIRYALAYPERGPSLTGRLDFAKLSGLTFFEPDHEAFPCLGAALEAVRTGGTAGAVLNGANEAAVERFLGGGLDFYGIYESVRAALDSIPLVGDPTLDDYIAADAEARRFVESRAIQSLLT